MIGARGTGRVPFLAAIGIAAVDVVLFAAGGEALTCHDTRGSVLRCDGRRPPSRPTFIRRRSSPEVADAGGLGPAQRALLERLHGNAGVDTRHTVLPLTEYGALRGIEAANDRYIEEATRPRGAGAARCPGHRPGWPAATWTC